MRVTAAGQQEAYLPLFTWVDQGPAVPLPVPIEPVETDGPIIELKELIKKLISENRSSERSRSRFNIETEVVNAYKSLSNAYGKTNEQHKLHYKKVHDLLKWILFNRKLRDFVQLQKSVTI
jgi:hypothetical protein